MFSGFQHSHISATLWSLHVDAQLNHLSVVSYILYLEPGAVVSKRTFITYLFKEIVNLSKQVVFSVYYN